MVLHVCLMVVSIYCVVFSISVGVGFVSVVVRPDMHIVTGGRELVKHECCRAVFAN